MTFDQRVLKIVRDELARDAETRLDRADGVSDCECIPLSLVERISDDVQDIKDSIEPRNPPKDNTSVPKDKWEKMYEKIREYFRRKFLEWLRDKFTKDPLPGEETPPVEEWLEDLRNRDPLTDPDGDGKPNLIDDEWWRDILNPENWIDPWEWLDPIPGPGGLPGSSLPMLGGYYINPLTGRPLTRADFLPFDVASTLATLGAIQGAAHTLSTGIRSLPKRLAAMSGKPSELCCDPILQMIEKEGSSTRDKIAEEQERTRGQIAKEGARARTQVLLGHG